MLAILLQQEEVWDGPLPPRSIYVLFVQGFNGIYIFFQAVVENIVFLSPGEGQTGKLNWLQIVGASGNAVWQILSGGLIRGLKYFALQVNGNKLQ